MEKLARAISVITQGMFRKEKKKKEVPVPSAQEPKVKAKLPRRSPAANQVTLSRYWRRTVTLTLRS